MNSTTKRGVAICHYNRLDNLKELVEKVKATTPKGTKVVVCDDGSTLRLPDLDVVVIKGPNLGVAANKNRALWALQDCTHICILEDDLFPEKKGWFEIYEKAYKLSGIHHFCRVQDKQVDETVQPFAEFMSKNKLTPIYGPSPRGDLTFITKRVINKVGAFNPAFRGAGFAHGEWSHRVVKAGLIPHPNKWVDIKEASESFIQKGDTTGGRWITPEEEIKKQLATNAEIYRSLQKVDYVHMPLILE